MALNPDQFHALFKSADRKDKRTIAGERFLRQDTLEGSSVGDEVVGSDAEWVTHDGYGLEATPTGGLRSVFGPSGRILEDVLNHKEGVAIINQHRSGEHWTQKSK